MEEKPLETIPAMRSQFDTGTSLLTLENQTFSTVGLWRPRFIVTGACLLCLGLLFYFHGRFSSAKEDLFVKHQMRELEQAALRSQMNPHFVFNALNSIQRCIAEGDNQTANCYLARFAKLMRSTLRFANTPKITLQEEKEMLENYLELECMRFKPALTYQISVPKDLDLYDVEIPPMLIQPLIENAIHHGLTPKNGPGMVHVDFCTEGRHLLVQVKDNGVGYQQSLLQKHLESGQHHSIGLMLTRRRLELLANTPEDSSLEIAENKDAAGSPCGTTAQLRISLKEEERQKGGFSIAALLWFL